MAVFGTRLAGAGYVVLNVIRPMNVISLLAVVAASVVMLVRTFNNNTFFFFDACEHVIRATICGFLILTELPLFKKYWIRKWPLFSQNSGFVMLGVSMILIGNSVLANLNKATASQDKLGMPFWRLVIASGIVVIVMGSINIVASYIFRDTIKHLTARRVRSNGATASHKADMEASIAASTPKQPRLSRYFPQIFKPEKRNSLPSYHEPEISRSNTAMSQKQQQQNQPYQHQFGPPLPTTNTYSVVSPITTVQTPINRDPVSPCASSKYSNYDSPKRPDLAHHPAMNASRF